MSTAIKQLLDEVKHDSENYQSGGWCSLPKPKVEADNIRLAPSAPLFAQLNILDIFKVNSLYIVKLMYSYHHRLLPTHFLNLFLTSGQIHN